jgi:hypothetical protein
VVVGEADDFDAAGFEGLREGNGRVEEEWLGAAGVGRCDGSFEVDEAVVGGLEEVGGIGEEGVPSIVVGVGLAGFGGVDDGLVGDDVSGGDEGDAGGFSGVGAGVNAGFSAAEVAECGNGSAAEEGAEKEGSEEPGKGLLDFG